MNNRYVPFGLLLIASWGVMTFTHEAGHIVGGWACGGTLQEARILPWELPYSIFDPDPQPLVTLWCGPILGAMVPIVMAAVVRRQWAWLIAHFCPLANGSYLAIAWLTGDRLLDTPKLLASGTHPATIAAYCSLTIGFGYIGFRRQCIRCLAPSPTVVKQSCGKPAT
ncbi:hypothetical protein [Limnoglobus roseus]|uniref:M50 family peptidase n=1 Tax=Limnoglobus roseus TaxID=2598579 RepID=A0A5C1ALI9_9BACT|nr:hypothetical protein [Limnoglobus roseus]QEL19435.1 hypothetical protein PX52LOC_06507 [Limnoglobus roseus]